MTRTQFQNLKVGDKIVIKYNSDYDAGKICEVVYIEDDVDACESFLVRVTNGEEFKKGNRFLKLVNWRSVEIVVD